MQTRLAALAARASCFPTRDESARDESPREDEEAQDEAEDEVASAAERARAAWAAARENLRTALSAVDAPALVGDFLSRQTRRWHDRLLRRCFPLLEIFEKEPFLE